MIAILDYDMGNIGSVVNMLKKIGCNDVTVTNDIEVIEKADKIILPGVGSFDEGMKRLKSLKLDIAIKNHSSKNKPIMGICLGMQLLGISSEEGMEAGLGLIDFECKLFKNIDVVGGKVPVMGWNYTKIVSEDDILKGFSEKSRFYFVHSYHAVAKTNDHILLTVNSEIEYVAAVRKKRIYGFQFHPEKSHKYGMKLFRNFVELI